MSIELLKYAETGLSVSIKTLRYHPLYGTVVLVGEGKSVNRDADGRCVACFWVSVARVAPNECVRQLIPAPLPVLAEGVGVYITRNTASLWLELRNQERARDDDVLMVERCSAPPVG